MLNRGLRQGGALGYVVCCNTVGGALAVDVDSESTVLHPKGGVLAVKVSLKGSHPATLTCSESEIRVCSHRHYVIPQAL